MWSNGRYVGGFIMGLLVGFMIGLVSSWSFTGNPLRVLLGLMGSAFGRLVGNH